MFKANKSNLQEIFIFSGILFLLLAIVNNSIFNVFAFSDEYGFIWQGAHGKYHDIWVNGFIKQGRGLIAFTNDILYPQFINKIPDLTILRVISLITYSGFGASLYFFLRNRIQLSTIVSSLLTLACLVVPGITVHLGWGTVYIYAFSDLFALWAGILTLDALVFKPEKKILLFCLAIVLSIACLHIYQSSFTLVLLPWFLMIMFTANNNWHVTIGMCLTQLCSLIIYYATWKGSIYFLGLSEANRSSLDLMALPKKILAFYPIIMQDIYPTSFLIIGSKLALYLGALVFLTAFYFLIKKISQRENKWLDIVCLIALFPASFWVNLVLEEYFLCSRTMHTTAMMTIVLQCALLFHFFNPAKWKHLLLLVPFLAAAYYNQNKAFGGLQISEYNLFNQYYSNHFNENPTLPQKLDLLLPPRNKMRELDCIRHPYSDEFGLLSSSVEWAAPNMYRMFALENLGNESVQYIQKMKIKTHLKSTDAPDQIDLNAIVENSFRCP